MSDQPVKMSFEVSQIAVPQDKLDALRAANNNIASALNQLGEVEFEFELRRRELEMKKAVLVDQISTQRTAFQKNLDATAIALELIPDPSWTLHLDEGIFRKSVPVAPPK